MPITNLAIHKKRWVELEEIRKMYPKEILKIKSYEPDLDYNTIVIKMMNSACINEIIGRGFYFISIDAVDGYTEINLAKFPHEKFRRSV